MTYAHLAKHFRLSLNNLKIVYWINDLGYLAGEVVHKVCVFNVEYLDVRYLSGCDV